MSMKRTFAILAVLVLITACNAKTTAPGGDTDTTGNKDTASTSPDEAATISCDTAAVTAAMDAIPKPITMHAQGRMGIQVHLITTEPLKDMIAGIKTQVASCKVEEEIIPLFAKYMVDHNLLMMCPYCEEGAVHNPTQDDVAKVIEDGMKAAVQEESANNLFNISGIVPLNTPCGRMHCN